MLPGVRQAEQLRGVLGVVEHVGGRLVDRHGPGAGRGIRCGTGVDLSGFETAGILGHCCSFRIGCSQDRLQVQIP